MIKPGSHRVSDPGVSLLLIVCFSLQTEHARCVINATHTWTFLTKHEGGTVSVFVCVCAVTNSESYKRRERMGLFSAVLASELSLHMSNRDF